MNRRELVKGSLGGVALPGIATADAPVRGGGNSWAVSARSEVSKRERYPMDFEWNFALGNLSDIEKDFSFGWGDPNHNAKTGDPTGPAHLDFDDGNWQAVNVPHDWGVGVGYDSSADESHGYKKIGRAWPENSIGWYRKTFEIPASDLGKRIRVEFDGVFRDCWVWFNGHPMGRHLSGYTSFDYDLTDYVNYGGKNVIAVRADASWYELWAYEGAGIYRHVWLVKTDPLHVARWGTYVGAEVKLVEGRASAELKIQTTLANDQDEDAPCTVISTIVDPDGKTVGEAETATTIGGWAKKEIIQKVRVDEATLWSPHSPRLYGLLTTVNQAGQTIDTYKTPFGIRAIRFDSQKGFFLNEERVVIKGVCCHQDHGGVGAAVPDRIHEYRIEKLKEMGANGLRCSHNPVAPELLDACDRLGMLAVAEVRMTGSTRELIGQMKSMMLRDRNHPSIILWCLGNEEMKIQKTVTGARILRSIRREAKKLDPITPVTLAIHGGEGGPVNEVLDVVGCNYEQLGDLDKLHQQTPEKPIFVSESVSGLSTRGVYEKDAVGRFTSYDENFASWGTTAENHWKFIVERPWLAGTFVWAGFDYGGEPWNASWPTLNTQFGIIDRSGFPKDIFFYYQSWWTDQTVLHIFPHWNWAGREGRELRVWAYSNCDEVDLILNGESLGRKSMPRNSHLDWKVRYQPGQLEAKGYNRGQLVATKRVDTTGNAAGLQLKPNRGRIRADNRDVSTVAVEVVDEKGRIVPTADNMINFQASGGKIIGVCNGDPACKVLENQTSFPAFNGLMAVIVQASRKAGSIVLNASSKGLRPARIAIEAE